MADAGKGGGARKYERNKIKCAAYKTADRRNVNKLRRLVRHFKARGVWDAEKRTIPMNWAEQDAVKAYTKLMSVLPNTVIKRVTS